MFNKIDIDKAVKEATSPKKLRDLRWAMNLRPSKQDIMVRRVQLHVDENPLEMVQLSTKTISAVEMLEGRYDDNCYEEVIRSYRGSFRFQGIEWVHFLGTQRG